jgi:hypothetical protein
MVLQGKLIILGYGAFFKENNLILARPKLNDQESLCFQRRMFQVEKPPRMRFQLLAMTQDQGARQQVELITNKFHQ